MEEFELPSVDPSDLAELIECVPDIEEWLGSFEVSWND